MKDLYDLTIKEASQKLSSKEIASVDLVSACLKQIKQKEPEINAFISVTEQEAINQAEKVDKKRANGDKLGPLAGIPFSLKDVYCTKGIETTAGSKILQGYKPQYNATVYEKLINSDAVLIGKTNCDPFGFGSSTEYSGYGATKNPHDTSRVPGGSSGGSGAAVSYGGGLFSIGEDTGGSIRCPASFCGIVGLKPTYGRVSRYGSIAYASSYDSVGPMTKTIEDNAIVLSQIAGHDVNDANTQKDDIDDYTKYLDQDISGKVIGKPKEFFTEGLEDEVKDGINKALAMYEDLGCEIREVSLPHSEYAIAAYYVVGLSEASANLARFDGIRYGIHSEGDDWQEQIKNTRAKGFSDEAIRRIIIGTFALSSGYKDAYYKKAQKVRELIKQDFAKAFEEVDIILTPTMPMLPFKLGANLSDPLQMWLADAFTVSINPAGLPALSVPANWSKDGLPIGMQLVAPHFAESLLYNFGYKYEKACNTN